METNLQSPAKNAMIYGSLIAVVSILYTLILYIADLDQNTTLQYVGIIFIIGGMLLGTLNYRNKIAGGFLPFGKAFMSSFLIGLFALILTSIFFYIYIKFINVGMIDEMIEVGRQKMAEQNLSEDQIDQAMEMQSVFMKPLLMALMGFVVNLIISTIIALIIAAFVKKEDKSLNSFS